MRALKSLALVVIMFATIVGCTSPAPTSPSAAGTSDDETAIRAASGSWPVAHNAGNVDTMVALYVDDAILMPPDAPAVAGHVAIRDYLIKDVADTKAAGVSIKDVASSVGVSGNLGWHAGKFAVVNASDKAVGTGKYCEIWRKMDGKWLMIRDMWNNDAPATKAPMK